MGTQFYVGTAGWTIPRDHASGFPVNGSHLERYAQIFNAVEINSSFYRHHKWQTYSKWAELTPEHFRFSVKLAKDVTHEKKLAVIKDDLLLALEGPQALGEKWGALLIQLAPSHQFDFAIADSFFHLVRDFYAGFLILEPRHVSWTAPIALQLLADYGVSITHADPDRLPPLDPAAYIGGEGAYFRLHGSPQIYKSKYTDEAIHSYAQAICQSAIQHVWCIFDNTTFGHATADAMELTRALTVFDFSEQA